MKTKHLIIALLVIVAIFIGKGMYVTDEVRETTGKSHQQFELFQATLHPLIDAYSVDVLDSTVKVAHGLMGKEEFLQHLELARKQQKLHLANYIESVRDSETIDDKELFIRTKDAAMFMDRVQLYVEADDFAAVNRMVDTGELYAIIDPLQKCLHRIAENRLKVAEDFKSEVDDVLKKFDRVMILSCVLIAIFAVAAVRYKETPAVTRRKNARTKRAKKQF